MTTKYDDTDIGKRQWIKNTLEARQKVRNAFEELSVLVVPNWKAVNVDPRVQYLHEVTLQYHSQIAAKANADPEQGSPFRGWDNILAHVEVPKSGEYEIGRTDRWGDYDLSNALEKVDRERKPVSLVSLDKEWGVWNEVELVLTLDGGEKRHERNLTAYLPPAAARTVMYQLDRVLEDIGWMPDAEEVGIHSEPLAPGGVDS